MDTVEAILWKQNTNNTNEWGELQWGKEYLWMCHRCLLLQIS